MNTQFHSGAEDRSWPFLAVQNESCKRETTWPLFSWVCLLLESDNPPPEKCTIYPRTVASLPATCTGLLSLTMHFLPSSRGVGFCRVCPENFPAKGLKILPVANKAPRVLIHLSSFTRQSRQQHSLLNLC